MQSVRQAFLFSPYFLDINSLTLKCSIVKSFCKKMYKAFYIFCIMFGFVIDKLLYEC